MHVEQAGEQTGVKSMQVKRAGEGQQQHVGNEVPDQQAEIIDREACQSA